MKQILNNNKFSGANQYFISGQIKSFGVMLSKHFSPEGDIFILDSF